MVVESAVTADQGLRRGASVSSSELSASPEPWHAVALNVVAHLQAQISDGDADARLASPLWQQLREAAPAEQVALVASLTVGAPLLFADRPAAVTFRRLLACSAAELDAAFGSQAAHNYSLVAGGDSSASESAQPDAFQRVVLFERDSLLFDFLRTEAARLGEAAQVVAVVGNAHLEPVSGKLAAARRGAFHDGVGHLLLAPAVTEAPSDEGVRRALLESLLALRCSASVVSEAVEQLGAVPEAQAVEYENTRELYSTTRMQLACLTRAQLAGVASPRSQGGDLWAALAPLREARPSGSGKGWSESALEVARWGAYSAELENGLEAVRALGA